LGWTLAELARRIGAELTGEGQREVDGVATLERAGPRDLSFLANPRYARLLASTRAGAVVLAPEHRGQCPVPALVTPNPYLGFARIAALLAPPPPSPRGVHPSAQVSPEARVHPEAWVGEGAVVGPGAAVEARAFVGPGCVLEGECVVGEDSRLVARVTVLRGTRIGRRVLVHPGAVLGADGFGFARDGERWVKVPQLGGVVVGDDVEIGANTTIDRGALEDTVIEEGVKLDNQIQVAHNVRIGAHTAIAGCTGIAGSAKIGARCTIGGGVGIVGHTEIADDVHITGMSFVASSIHEPGVYSSGTPLEPNRTWRRNYARFRQLDAMARRLRELEGLLRELEGNGQAGGRRGGA